VTEAALTSSKPPAPADLVQPRQHGDHGVNVTPARGRPGCPSRSPRARPQRRWSSCGEAGSTCLDTRPPAGRRGRTQDRTPASSGRSIRPRSWMPPLDPRQCWAGCPRRPRPQRGHRLTAEFPGFLHCAGFGWHGVMHAPPPAGPSPSWSPGRLPHLRPAPAAALPVRRRRLGGRDGPSCDARTETVTRVALRTRVRSAVVVSCRP
jgi:hypothetical protein